MSDIVELLRGANADSPDHKLMGEAAAVIEFLRECVDSMEEDARFKIAINAMSGILASEYRPELFEKSHRTNIAEHAYAMADTMLEMRKFKGGSDV